YLHVANNSDERKQFSKGVESTLIYYPAKGLTLRLAASYKRVTQGDAMELFKRLLAAAIARGNENPAYIPAAQQTVTLNGFDGREIAGPDAARFGFNYAVSYRFGQESRLKGVSLGVNGNYNDDYILGYSNDNQGIHGGNRLVVNGSVGYDV